MGPLPEMRVNAGYVWLPETRTAVVEMATASGLPLLKPDQYNPLKTTTYGTGQLITAAIDHGAEQILLAIGGSATVDGGVGAAMALGWRFLKRMAGRSASAAAHCRRSTRSFRRFRQRKAVPCPSVPVGVRPCTTLEPRRGQGPLRRGQSPLRRARRSPRLRPAKRRDARNGRNPRRQPGPPRGPESRINSARTSKTSPAPAQQGA